jgi:hypothetical protein
MAELKNDDCGHDDMLLEIDSSLPASHESQLAEFHVDRAAVNKTYPVKKGCS